MGGEDEASAFFAAQPPLRHMFPFGCCGQVDMRLFMSTCKLCTLQYSVLRPALAVVTLALYSAGEYREGDFSYDSAYLWATLLNNCSVTLALYYLVYFYGEATLRAAAAGQPVRQVPRREAHRLLLVLADDRDRAARRARAAHDRLRRRPRRRRGGSATSCSAPRWRSRASRTRPSSGARALDGLPAQRPRRRVQGRRARRDGRARRRAQHFALNDIMRDFRGAPRRCPCSARTAHGANRWLHNAHGDDSPTRAGAGGDGREPRERPRAPSLEPARRGCRRRRRRAPRPRPRARRENRARTRAAGKAATSRTGRPAKATSGGTKDAAVLARAHWPALPYSGVLRP